MAVELLWVRPVFWEVGACLGMHRSFDIWEAQFNFRFCLESWAQKSWHASGRTFGLDYQSIYLALHIEARLEVLYPFYRLL